MLALDTCAVQFSRTRLYLVTACLSLVKFCSADIALQFEYGQKAFFMLHLCQSLAFYVHSLPIFSTKNKTAMVLFCFWVGLGLPSIAFHHTNSCFMSNCFFCFQSRSLYATQLDNVQWTFLGTQKKSVLYRAR